MRLVYRIASTNGDYYLVMVLQSCFFGLCIVLLKRESEGRLSYYINNILLIIYKFY